MAKIKHIAIRAEDVEGTVKFFTEVFGLSLVQRRAHGPVDLTDGDVNITVLPLNIGANANAPLHPGFDHIGFSVADEAEEADRKQKLLQNGAKELNPIQLGDVFYEAKFQWGNEQMVIDVGHWIGTSPVPQPATAGAKE